MQWSAQIEFAFAQRDLHHKSGVLLGLAWRDQPHIQTRHLGKARIGSHKQHAVRCHQCTGCLQGIRGFLAMACTQLGSGIHLLDTQFNNVHRGKNVVIPLQQHRIAFTQWLDPARQHRQTRHQQFNICRWQSFCHLACGPRPAAAGRTHAVREAQRRRCSRVRSLPSASRKKCVPTG